MKSLRRILVPLSIVAILATIFLLNYKKITGAYESEEEGEKEPTAGMVGQLESWWQARAYPDPTYINDKWLAAWQQEQAMRNSDLLTGMNNSGNSQNAARIDYGAWTSLGPDNATGPGGRIISLAVSPANSQVVFAGSASGGIWKSVDGANNWNLVQTNLPVLGVSSIIISSANSNVIYAGTGEVYRNGNSNIGYSVWKARGTYGIGVIKSTDGGLTWSQVLTRSTSDLFGIQKLKFSNTSDNTVFACATNGLWRTTDAGATWANIAPGKIYVRDMVINSAHPDSMMITVGNLTDTDKGIYRTTNGTSANPTWTKLTNQVPASGAFDGFVRLAYGSGDMVTASFSDKTGSTIRRTTNFGNTWSTLYTGSSSSDFNDIQYWCTNVIEQHPTNANLLILGGIDLYRLTVGNSPKQIGTNVHDDIHAVVFDPNNSNTFYVGCDGGVYKCTVSGTTYSFSKKNNGLGATQFYASFGVSSLTPNLFIGGLQDNGAMKYNGSGWSTITWMGGDGTTCAISPINDNINIACRDARGIYRTNGVNSGQVAPYWGFNADSRTAFVAPLAFSKSDPDRVYCATDVLHKSTDAGANWSDENYGSGTPPTTPNNFIDAMHKTGLALAVSPTNAAKLYVSTSPFAQYDDDQSGLYVNPPPGVLRTTNATSATTTFTSIKNNLPDRFVTDFAIVPGHDDSVYVVLGGFSTSHVWVTGNGGASWVDRGAGLPDVPFNSIIVDPSDTRFIYAGSDLGVYVSNNRGQTWYSYSGGFVDAVMVFDLQITADNKLVAATHGRGVWITDLATNSPLPVNILEFTGANKNYYNELKWKVGEESNVARYELERKIDNGSFTKIANIPARNTVGTSTYVHNDDISNTSGANYYYRLRIVDRDGAVKYSSVVLVKVNRRANLEILGNPVTSGSSIVLSVNSPQRVVFKLFDIRGRLLHVSTVDASGTNRYSLNMFGVLPAGHYMLQAVTNTERFTKRLIVK